MRRLWPGILAIVLATLFGVLVMDRLPERMPVHWNFRGEVDRWGSRTEGVFLLPAVSLLAIAILVIAPRLDPRRRNFPMHSGAYWITGNALMLFLAAIHVAVIAHALGYPVVIGRIVPAGIGILLMVIGNYITQARPNWVFGIRTPWTLSSDRSWRETHRVGGRLFVLAGAATLLAALAWPGAVVVVMLTAVAGVALFTLFWSWLVWSRDPEARKRMEEGR